MNLTYYECLQMNADMFELRRRMLLYAKKHGVKAAVREFGCSRNTVRKWLHRADPRKPSSIQELSRAPKSCPHRIPKKIERQVASLRKKTGFGAQRLKMEFDLPVSEGAIKRVCRDQGLVKERKKKHKTKKQLREKKKQWKLFSQISAETKYLTDIPFYWGQMMKLGLPKFQYTAREVVSGLTFTGYADENSKTYMCLFSERVSAHLAWHGVDVRSVLWQTDNGAENLRSDSSGGLPDQLAGLGSKHRYIPPKAHTWQSDVETVHRLVEDEFFDREVFGSQADFWNKTRMYWYWFNIARKNRGKEWKAPAQLIDWQREKLLPALACWPALDLGQCFSQYVPRYNSKGGHHVPAHP